MGFLNKVTAANDPIRSLIITLSQLLGNKRYLHDLEDIMNRLELSSYDVQTVWYLVRDLKRYER